MVKRVMVPEYEANDGTRHKTKAAAQLHEWLRDPVDVQAKDIKHKGVTWDLRGNLWQWSCGRCSHPAPQPLDTMFKKTSATCSHCSAGNLFDFSNYPH